MVEAALELGKLKGIWAKFYQRREAIYQTAEAEVMALPSKLDIDWSSYADEVVTLMSESDQSKKLLKATALALITNAYIFDKKLQARWRKVTASAIVAALAEGYIEALILMKKIKPKDAWALYPGLVKQFANSDMAEPGSSIAQQLSGLAGDVATSARGATDITSAKTLANQAMQAAKGAVLYLQETITLAIGTGSLHVYKKHKQQKIRYLDAGDAHECSQCEMNAIYSPYPIDEVPTIPQHANCLIGTARVVVPTDVSQRLSDNIADFRSSNQFSSSSATTVTQPSFNNSGISTGMSRDFVGDVIEIELSNGYKLTATPNHPIATRSGWVAISKLNLGDNVLCSTNSQWEVFANPHENHIPSTIQEIVESLPMRLGVMPTSSQDFHGDGIGSQVHVVYANGFLRDGLNAISKQGIFEKNFSFGNSKSFLLNRQSMFFFSRNRNRLSSPRFMSCLGKPLSFLRRSLRHPHKHRLTSSTRNNIVFDKNPSNGTTADTEGFCESLLTSSSEVATSEVVNINVLQFSGQVYNLETINGYYISNGIITHNCRCSYAPYP